MCVTSPLQATTPARNKSCLVTRAQNTVKFERAWMRDVPVSSDIAQRSKVISKRLAPSVPVREACKRHLKQLYNLASNYIQQRVSL